MKKKLFFISFSCVLLLFACTPKPLLDKTANVDEKGWKPDAALQFSVEVTDLTALHNFYVTIRNTTDYKYSNIYLFIQTQFPNQKFSKDTVECLLANANGKWKGKGWGKIKDNRFLVKQDFRFPVKGIYTFYIRQAMRDKELVGIKNLGINIENNKIE
ncbi:MAG: gliding motility lipoprotein GldH [Lentimicrobiaceae bacterium]|nr:gliding motility lipoprotein GldH [Lentimicrobiaceae bacterium]